MYAKSNHEMYKGNNCGHRNQFSHGTTNGADWYVVEGAMQDYNYFVSNAIELTAEISCCKYIPEKQLSVEWHRVQLLHSNTIDKNLYKTKYIL